MVDLRALGFWRAVARVKRDEALRFRYAERIARIDRDAFRRAVPLRLPATVGVGLLVFGLVVGILILIEAPRIATVPASPHPWLELAVLVGFGALDVTTHGLAHAVAGAMVGIRFTDWFVVLPSKPQPGLKIDYASYLRASSRGRAWMHAAGAIATKLTPFVVLAYALWIAADTWAIGVLALVGVLQIATDVLFSVSSSDWKKFRREMRLART